jgi:PAS domain-containing protein
LQVLQKGVELREQVDMFIRKDGSFLPVVYSASPLTAEGRTIGIVVGFRDDTPRREAERALRESEARFRLVANTAPVLLWMTGVDKLCTFVNDGWLEFTGRSLEELGSGSRQTMWRSAWRPMTAFDQRTVPDGISPTADIAGC